MKNREEDLAKELFEQRDEPGQWNDEPEQDVKPGSNQVLSFRLSLRELEALQQAAEALGETVSEYIRAALVLRIQGVPIGPAVEVTSGSGTLTVRSRLITKSPNENGASDFVSDMPPSLVSLVDRD